MDDKKKIIFLSIAVAVAIGLVVLIVTTRKGEETGQPTLPLPSTPPYTTPGTPSGTGQPGQPDQAGGATGVTSSMGGAPSVFLPKPAPTESSGFIRTSGGVYVAPGTSQPKEFVPTPISISDSYLISQITSSSISELQQGLDTSVFTTSTILNAVSSYLKSLGNLPMDQAKLQDILNSASGTVANLPTVQSLAQQFLNSVTGTNATDILGSLSGIQGITADQMSYLQSLVASTSTIPLSQGLLELGAQNQDFISNFLANATGSISVDRLRTLLQQFETNSSAECDQLTQQIQSLKNMEASAGGSFGMDVIWQYLPMQGCGVSTSTSRAQG